MEKEIFFRKILSKAKVPLIYQNQVGYSLGTYLPNEKANMFPNSKFPKRVSLLASLIILSLSWIDAQTVLQPGDLAVLGVNTNNFNCSGNSTEDLISFVVFQPIEAGTILDITDNGWERQNPGFFGDSEGAIRASYNGNTIPAGEVITFLSINNPETYECISHPDWAFATINPQGFAFNMNNGGDQLFFMQNGNWDIGSDVDNTHDASYTGAILFGFNSRSIWNSNNTTQQSNLHPDIIPCFHMEPSSGQSDFLKYTGPITPATQLQWIARIGDANNWQAFPDCATYNATAPNYPEPFTIPILPSGMSVDCSFCSSCQAPLQDTLTFTLPETGGPFNLEYTDGTDTFNLMGVNDGHQIVVTVNSETTYQLVSVTDIQSCPVFSNFERVAIISFGAPPDIEPLQNASVCDSFTLPPIEGTNLSANAAYFTASQGEGTQFTPGQIITQSTQLFIFDGGVGCFDEETFNVTINPSPIIELGQINPISCFGASDGALSINVIGNNPTVFDWNVDELDGSSQANNLAPGNYQVNVVDEFGCSASNSFQLSAPLPLAVQIETVQPDCSGDESGTINILSVNGGTAPYAIQNGNNFEQIDQFPYPISNLNTGDFNLLIQDIAACQFDSTIIINAPENLVLELGQNQTIQLGDSLTIDASANFEVTEIVWTPGETLNAPNTLKPVAKPNETTTYTLRLTSVNGCSIEQSITIFVSNERNLFFPNAFSPNGDGANDEWTIFADGTVKEIKRLLIFDRWGDVLFERKNFQPNDLQFSWNGRYRGQELQTGVYTYFAEIEFANDQIEILGGDILLMR